MPQGRNTALAVAASLAAWAAAGCAAAPVAGQPLPMRPPAITAAAAAAAPEGGFSEQGQIQFTPAGTPGASAAWDARSVRGPAVNMTLTDEGLWGGTLRGRPVLLRAARGRITGEGVNVYVTQEGPMVHIQGMWFGKLLRIDVSPTTLSASPTAGVCSMELAVAEDGYWRGFGGCGGRLTYTWMTLRGVAGDPSAEMPQWLFAFLASLPSPQTTVFPNAAFAGGLGPRSGYLPASAGGPQLAFAPAMPCSPFDQRQCGPMGWNPSVNGWFGGNAGGDQQTVRTGGPGGGRATAASRGPGGGSRQGGLNRGGGRSPGAATRGGSPPGAPRAEGTPAAGRTGVAESRGSAP